MRLPRKGIIIICALAVLQSVARIVLPIMLSAEGVQALEEPVSDELMAFINAMFFALGGLGFLTAYGLWGGRYWGYVGTIAVSVLTIAFDIWAIATVQWSAALGLVLPIVFIAYLVKVREGTGAAVAQ